MLIIISKNYQFVDNSGIVEFNLESVLELKGFLPYNGDIDVNKRQEELQTQTGTDKSGDAECGDEKIIHLLLKKY